MPPEKISTYLCFDPRDSTQMLHDRSTWKRSDNAILISATMLYAVHGEKCPISWDKVAILADLCEDPDILPTVDAPPLPTLEETNAMLRAALERRTPRRAPRIAPQPTVPRIASRRVPIKRGRARATPASRRTP